MAEDGGVPATRRLISERLRGRLSGSVFINSRDSFLPCDWWGGGGSRRERTIVQSFTDAKLIVQSLILFLKPSDLPEHLGVFALISITAPFDRFKLNF